MSTPMPDDARSGRASPAVLTPGTRAPAFTLPRAPDANMSLSELRGRPVVLVFYPADWSPVCGEEVTLFNQVLPELRQHGAEVLGISVDGVWCHRAFAEAKNLHFPLLSDFEPKGEVSRSYGAYEGKAGTSARALFVLDGDGVVRWSYLSPIDVNPGADGVLEALESMSGAASRTGATT